jgi:hypothetical protein
MDLIFDYLQWFLILGSAATVMLALLALRIITQLREQRLAEMLMRERLAIYRRAVNVAAAER